jgi:hypothetical protein
VYHSGIMAAAELFAPVLPCTFCSSYVQQKRAASFRTRTVSTVAMIAGFLAIIYMGHVPLVLLVLTLQVSIQPSPPWGGACSSYGHMSVSHGLRHSSKTANNSSYAVLAGVYGSRNTTGVMS